MKIIIEQTEGKKAVCFLPPKRRTILASQSKYSPPQAYFLSFPYMVFSINKMIYEAPLGGENVNVEMAAAFAANEPMNSSFLYVPSLPNIDFRGTVCLGDHGIALAKTKNFKSMIRSLVDYYFSSLFIINELNDCVGKYIDLLDWSPLCSFNSWQAKTKSDLLWIPGSEDMLRCTSAYRFSIKNQITFR